MESFAVFGGWGGGKCNDVFKKNWGVVCPKLMGTFEEEGVYL